MSDLSLSPKRRTCILLCICILIFAVSLLFRLMKLVIDPGLQRDPTLYLQWATHWYETGDCHFFQASGDPVQTPIFPIWALKELMVSGLGAEVVGRGLSLFLGSMIPVISFVIALRVFQNIRIALVTALLLAVQPDLVPYSVQPLRENFYVFFEALLLLTIVESVKNGTYFNWGLCGVLVSFISFCRYEGMEFILIVPFVIVGMAFIDGIKRKRALLNIASFSVCFGIASVFLLSLSNFEIGVMSKIEDIIEIRFRGGGGAVHAETAAVKVVEKSAESESGNLFDYITKIVKGVNVIIFIWTIPGVYLVLKQRRGKDNRKLYLFFAVTGFMIAWRVAIKIITSRYSVALIIPFALFAAFFLVDSGKKRHGLVMSALCAFVICTFVVYVDMNFDSISRYHYSTVVSDVFRKYDETQESFYIVRRAEYSRIPFMSATKNAVRPIKDSETFYDFFKKQGGIYPGTIVYYQIRKNVDGLRGFRNVKCLVSLPQNEDGSKRQVICSIAPELEPAPDPETAPVSETGTGP